MFANGTFFEKSRIFAQVGLCDFGLGRIRENSKIRGILNRLVGPEPENCERL